MTEPQRAARLWVAVAVAPLGLLSGGGRAEATIPVGTLLALPASGEPGARPRRATPLRLASVFRRGWLSLRVALLNHHRLPLGRCVPEPWPRAAQGITLSVPIEVPLAA
jgi:hypothetical protein